MSSAPVFRYKSGTFASYHFLNLFYMIIETSKFVLICCVLSCQHACTSMQSLPIQMSMSFLAMMFDFKAHTYAMEVFAALENTCMLVS